VSHDDDDDSMSAGFGRRDREFKGWPLPEWSKKVSLNPFDVVRQFEAALCEYTGATYAVTTTSCTMALLLAVACCKRVTMKPLLHPKSDRYGKIRFEEEPMVINIPSRTYVSVPQSIIHAGCKVSFRDEAWTGAYQLRPTPVWDSARRFTSGMFVPGQMQCVSFHWCKILGIQQGGAILHDNPYADEWLRRARFDGRREGVAPKDDDFDVIGWHAYMSPEIAAEGLVRLSLLPKHNADLKNDDYPDLSAMRIFR
jgi:dTDP-4-amino-4,6-dideoxygalactose transaminase